MKKRIFDQYVSEVCKRYDIDPTELFSQTKKRDIIEARYMLYYLCYNRPMKNSEIVRYMFDNGFVVTPRNINYGIERMRDNVRDDEDYEYVINKIKECVTP